MKKFFRAWRWPLITGTLLITVYGIVAAIWIPMLARQQLEAYVTERLQRNIAIGAVTFNPFTLTLRLSDLALTERDGTALVRMTALTINANVIASLWHRAPALDAIELIEPRVHAILRPDGTLNLADLAKAASPNDTSVKTAGPPLRIDRLLVQRGAIELVDRSRKRAITTTLEPIELALEDLQTDGAHENVHRLTAALPGGGELTWEGRFSLTPLGAKGSIQAHGVAAKTLDDYLDEQPYQLADGQVDFAGTYRLALRPKLSFGITLQNIEAHDLTVASRNADGAAPLQLGTATVRDLDLAWPAQSIHMKALTVREANVLLVRDADGTLNLARWLGPAADAAASAPPSAAATMASAAWRFDADAIDFEQGKVSFDDESTLPAAHLAMTLLTLSVRHLSTVAGAKSQVSVSSRINDAGSISAQGSFRLAPFATALDVNSSDLTLAGLQPYLVKRAAATLHSGKLGFKGRLEMTASASQPTKVGFNGDVRVDDLATTDNALNEDLLKWRSVELAGVDFGLAPDHLNVEHVLARAPYGRLTIGKDSVLNLTHVLHPNTPIPPAQSTATSTATEGATTAAAPSTEPPTPVFPVNIRNVDVEEGTASFADYSIEPTFSADIGGVQGNVSELSSMDDARANLRLEGQVDRYAPVTLTGQANWLAPTKYADLDINFRNMDLTTLNPYAGKFAGYSVSKGKLSSEIKYRVVGGRVEGQHHLVLNSLEFGRATGSKEAVSLPVKLAVGLLKNRNQIIELDLPMRGDVGDPQLRFGSIMRKVFVGLLAKVAASPFKLFGAPFGGGEELAYVEFAPGSATLVPSEQEKLAKLARVLLERPKLKLSIPMTVAPHDDAMGYARQKLAMRVPAPTNLDTDELAKKQRVTALEQAYTADVGQPAPASTAATVDLHIAELEMQLVTAYMPNQKQLEMLGRARADAIENALLQSRMILPERVFKSSGDTPMMSEGQVRLALELQ